VLGPKADLTAVLEALEEVALEWGRVVDDTVM
jgi:hypothetical protein